MAPRVYYNEHDKFAAAWLRELIADGQIPAGTVDERDIRDVLPSDLDGYDQCHFFAGIGGWALALRYAGLEGVSGVWTGSCPCQSFSAAGKQMGFADERHLWPSFFHLIEQCRPASVFGEQVASKLALEWLDLVQADLEGAGYAAGTCDLPAASVGAPHIRQRLWWCAMANAELSKRRTLDSALRRVERQHTLPQWPQSAGGSSSSSAMVISLADADSMHAQGRQRDGADASERQVSRHGPAGLRGGDDGMGDTCSARTRWDAGAALSTKAGRSSARRADGFNGGDVVVAPSDVNGVGDASSQGWSNGSASSIPEQRETWDGSIDASHPWSDLEWLSCRDGKARPTQPGLQPLAHGVPNRVGTLRGAGNAICPQTAAEFIRACA